MNKPMISALMLTKNRFKLFKQAVNDFVNQTHNNKELIIVNNGSIWYKFRVDRFIKGINANIKHIKIPRMTLGEMRNIGINNCSGEFIMIFDDDDVHHSERMEQQLDIILKSNVDATLLSNFTASIATGRYLCHAEDGLEGTILFKHPKGIVYYPKIDQGEDTKFKRMLKHHGYIIITLNLDHDLYEYRFHGKNTVSLNHFYNMVDRTSFKSN